MQYQACTATTTNHNTIKQIKLEIEILNLKHFLLQGTGANFLATGVYFTFLFSFLLLILTTAHFLIGASLEKVRQSPVSS